MSFSETAMTERSSSTISRRLFAKRSVAALAATAGLALAGTAAGQEANLFNEGQTARQTPDEATTETRSGQYIVDFALQFVGYPYVWAGNTPAGFDCSGFTQYVILNAVGIDIGHGTGGQMSYGTWVDAADLQPGDLVYFAGTYGSGVSHAGIYIGDHQFVHAENPGTGVTISWLWSDYYGGHYCGAMRHW